MKLCQFDLGCKGTVQNNGSGNASADGGGSPGMPLYVGEPFAEYCFSSVIFCSFQG